MLTAVLAVLDAPILLLVGFYVVVFLALPTWLFWRIFQKCGWPGWYALFALIPYVAIVLFFLLALAEWPVERRVREFQRRDEAVIKT